MGGYCKPYENELVTGNVSNSFLLVSFIKLEHWKCSDTVQNDLEDKVTGNREY